jgi:hypothetical protein
VYPQLVPLQVDVEPVNAGHAEQLAPHVATAWSSTHVPRHSCAPVAQVSAHLSSTQTGWEKAAPGQTVQLARQAVALALDTHVPPHAWNPPWQPDWHTPATHTARSSPASEVHTVPHAPQLFTSVCVSTHLPSQVSENGAAQVAEQAPALHTGVPSEQTSPHLAQSSVVPSAVSQPGAATLQSA